jgi:hypothetical protein
MYPMKISTDYIIGKENKNISTEESQLGIEIDILIRQTKF